MNPKLQIVWIDDEPGRESIAKTLGEHLNKKHPGTVTIKFKDVKEKVLSDELEQLTLKEMPDLILMDHKLVDVDGGCFKSGTTAAEALREQWPECPIVCITGVDPREIPLHQKELYDEIFPVEDVSKSHATLLSIGTSYQKIREVIKNSEGHAFQELDNLFKLLMPHEEDIQRLKSIIPTEIKKSHKGNDKSLLMIIARWVRKTLMEKPGFLYDRLWTATFLGLKESSLKKVEKIFDDALYKGVFADKNNKRWWQSKLRHILYSITEESESIYPWERGRLLKGITEADYSKCGLHKEDFPETVAYLDETATDRVPMRLRYTIPHPAFEKSLYFEEIRMMKGAE